VSFNRRVFVLAVLVIVPGAAQSQFTTFIPPRNKVADSVKAVVAAEQKAQSDSAQRLQITNMKTWVDSAAGIVTPATRADSLAQSAAVLTDTTTFRNGSRAPATASSLPLLATLGCAALLIGACLVGGDRRQDGA